MIQAGAVRYYIGGHGSKLHARVGHECEVLADYGSSVRIRFSNGDVTQVSPATLDKSPTVWNTCVKHAYRHAALGGCPLCFKEDALTIVVAASPEVKATNPKDAVASAKLPLWLLSPIAKAHWAVAQAVGMVKYGAWNWRVSGVRNSIYLSAIQRHFDRYLSGQDYDPVDGQHNLGAIMACCAIILDAEEAGKLNDDRPPSVALQRTYDQMEAVFKQAIDRANAAKLNPVHHTIKDTNAST